MAEADTFTLLARYNRWMNENLHRAACRLDPLNLDEDRGAFFGSVLGTLNHIMVADIYWLKRFTRHPAGFAALQPMLDWPQPKALDERLHDDIDSWWHARRELDAMIVNWSDTLTDDDLSVPLAYTNRKGEPFRKRFGDLVLHLFNHQTHHRGQASTLFQQMGVDIGVTDLPALIPDM